MSTHENFSTLQPGDTVLYIAGAGLAYQLREVKKVTASGRVTLTTGSTFKANGSPLGGTRMDSNKILLATPERLATMNK